MRKKAFGFSYRDYFKFGSSIACIFCIPFIFNWLLLMWDTYSILSRSSIVINVDKVKTRFLPFNGAAKLSISIDASLDALRDAKIYGFRAQLIDKSIFGGDHVNYQSFEVHMISIQRYQNVKNITFNIGAHLPKDSEIVKKCNERSESEIELLLEIIYSTNGIDKIQKNQNIRAKINCHAPTIEEILLGFLFENKRNAEILLQ